MSLIPVITYFRNHSYDDLVINSIHSKQCWVVLTQIWVKYGQTQNVIKNVQLKVKVLK